MFYAHSVLALFHDLTYKQNRFFLERVIRHIYVLPFFQKDRRLTKSVKKYVHIQAASQQNTWKPFGQNSKGFLLFIKGRILQILLGCFAAIHLEALRAKQLGILSLYIYSCFAHTTNMKVQVNYTQVCWVLILKIKAASQQNTWRPFGQNSSGFLLYIYNHGLRTP